MTRRSQHRRSLLTKLLLGAAPALLLFAATPPAEAWGGVGHSFRTCERQDSRRLDRAIRACTAVIDNERATVVQVQGALISRAAMRARRNDLTGAASDLEQAQRMGAEDAATLVALGQVRARLNDPDAALEAFTEAADSATGQDAAAAFEAALATGAIQLERQQWRQAIDSYSRALRLTTVNARRARALIGRGHAHLGAGDIAAAIEDYDDAIVRDPNSVDAMLAFADAHRTLAARGNASSFTIANTNYAEALRRIGPDATAANARRLLARAYAGRGDLYLQRYLSNRNADTLRQASRDFEDAVEADSQNVAALVGRAGVYSQTLSTRQRAIADLDRAARLAPHDGEILRARGDLYASLNDSERAMRDYDEALQRGGNQSYHVYFQRGVIYLNAGDYVRADQSFAQAAALARHGPLPPGMDTGAALAEALLMRSRANWNLIDAPGVTARNVAAQARDFADEAARWGSGRARYQAGRCLTRSVAGGEWSTAQQACTDAIRLAQQTGNTTDLSDAYGAMGMLQLRWALAGATNGAAEATHLQYAVNYFSQAVSANRDSGAQAALYLYANGVALDCLGRQIEGNRLMREALNADRGVESRFLAHRIRHCQA